MTEVQLCNLALIWLKVERIESLDEDSEAADLCGEYLQICIDDALTEFHHFTFSKKYISIEDTLAETYRDYQYMYAIPEDFLKPIEMVDLLNGDWEFTADGIACDTNPLKMVYIQRKSVVADLPNPFARAVSMRIASSIGPILSPSKIQEIAGAEEMYMIRLREAANLDGGRERLSVQGSYELLED